MKLKFIINLKESKIPDWIEVPKTLKESKDENYAKHFKDGKFNNFIEKKYLKKIYLFEFDIKKKTLESLDKFPNWIHGIYPGFDLNKGKLDEEGFITCGWYLGFQTKFLNHDFMIQHFVTFDPEVKNKVLINKVGYFFKKDKDEYFKSYDESYIWMDLVT
jgi:hypothetical protein